MLRPFLPHWLCAALCLCLSAAQASDPASRGAVDSFLQDANLSSRRIFDIAFERDRVAWAATSDGLYRCDGFQWERLSAEKHGLPSNFVRSVTVTRSGEIWVGTDHGAGVLSHTDAGWRFTLTAPPERMAGRSVRKIREARDGALWFCNDAWPDPQIPRGITRWSGGVWQAFSDSDDFPGQGIEFLSTSRGEEFAMTPTVCRYADGKWQPVFGARDSAWNMVETPDGTLAALVGKQLALRRDGAWTMRPVSGDVGKLLLATRAGEIFTLRSAGVGLVAFARWDGAAFTRLSPSGCGAPNMAEQLLEAPDGALWAVGDNLLLRWDRTGRHWTEWPGLPAPAKRAEDGRIWFASGEDCVALSEDGTQTSFKGEPGGTWLWDAEGNLWQHSPLAAICIPQEPGAAPVRFSAANLKIGEILDATPLGSRVCLFNRRSAAVVDRYGGYQPAEPLDPDGGSVLAAAPHADGSPLFLVSSEGRPPRILRQDGSRYADAPLLHQPNRARLFEDGAGGLWAYAGGGVQRRDPASAQWTAVDVLRGANILGHLVGPAKVWFAFDAGIGGELGLAAWDGRRWDVAALEANATAAASPEGDVCFGTSGGVLVIPGERMDQAHVVGAPAGVEPRRLVFGKDGRIWMGGISASSGLRTYCYATDHRPPRVRIEYCDAHLPSGRKLGVRASGTEYFVPRQSSRKFRYSWRFDGGEWTPFQALPSDGIDAAALGVGEHRLALRCQDEDLDVSPEVGAAFQLLPAPLQSRWWFRPAVIGLFSLLGATAVAAVVAAYRYRCARAVLSHVNSDLERRVAERAAELEREITARRTAEVEFAAVLAERNRLGAELHDMLQQGIAGVSMQIQAARMLTDDSTRVAQLLDTAHQLLDRSQTEVRRSIWDLRSQMLERFDLATAATVVCSQIATGSAVQPEVSVKGAPYRLTLTVENGLLRIVQEAMANIVRHSGATRADLELRFAPGAFTLRIQDNGRGFDAARPPHPDDGHFGLIGMRERAARLGGELTIASSSGGTIVEFHLLTPASLSECQPLPTHSAS